LDSNRAAPHPGTEEPVGSVQLVELGSARADLLRGQHVVPNQ
jgi:hypothetical protein